ncbi:MAG: hypothetical protein MZU91_00025 [Desulfosudis oleivorans]|nr:hypothetical protein [Desulfosudis oleivorans]
MTATDLMYRYGSKKHAANFMEIMGESLLVILFHHLSEFPVQAFELELKKPVDKRDGSIFR